MPIGFHVSIAGGICSSIERTVALGCDAMQIFAANPRGWSFTPREEKETALFRERREGAGISTVAVHTTYLINLASPDPVLFKKSINLFKSILSECEALGADFLVTHMGSPRGKGSVYAAERVVEALEKVFSVKTRGAEKTLVLLENTSGAGSGFGAGLAEIGGIIDAASALGIKTGLCFDTCHAFAAGYPMSGADDAKKLVDAIGNEAGLERLKLIHLNDSKGETGSKLDRHEHIGEGKIGLKGLGPFLNHPKIKGIPIIMETPQKAEGDEKKNLKAARKLLGGS